MFGELKESLKSKHVNELKSMKIVFDKRMEDKVGCYNLCKEQHKPIEYLRKSIVSRLFCLLHPRIETTNNHAERVIKEHVVLRKIIGTFRYESGSQNYQYIAYLLSTWRLKGLNMFVETNKILKKDRADYVELYKYQFLISWFKLNNRIISCPNFQNLLDNYHIYQFKKY